ncbi:MAG: M56 family metallopeptidase [Candidatus Eremiobacteraeota bacterium]|nr:M56 family metallopeptidase [Candidatus Eremiobacteraeota bacterium]
MLTALAPFQGAAHALVTYAVTALWMGAAIAALTALVVRCWKPLDAATRYAVWYVALIAVVLGPLATTVAMEYTRPAPRVADLAAALSTSQTLHTQVNVALPRTRMTIAIPPYVAFGAAALWLLVVLGGAARFGAGVIVLARLKRDALPLAPEHRSALSLWNAHAGAHSARRARLCVSDRVEVPVAVGLFDGMVVLPQHILDAFEPGDVDRFVLHELAHLERRDDWTAVFERLAQIVLFFNPFVHVIAKRLDLEREIACDDRVVEATSDVRSYAVGLTRMAESTKWPHNAIAAPAIFVTRKQLSLRVEELLARRRLTAPGVAIAPAAVALIVSLGVVAAAAVHAPSVDVGGASHVAPREITRVHETKLILLDRNGKKTMLGAKRARVMVVHGDVKSFDDVRAFDEVSPERVRALLKKLEADGVVRQTAPPPAQPLQPTR